MKMQAGARLFFALWPDAPTRRALGAWAHDLRAGLGGRRVADADIHLTLFFLGQVPDARVPRMQSAPSMDCGPFDLVIDHVGWWRHNQIAWAAPVVTPHAMNSLVHQLGQWLRAQHVEIDSRPFAPHVTLLRGARSGTVPVFAQPIRWRVDEFALVRSNLQSVDSRYAVIGRFPLSLSLIHI